MSRRPPIHDPAARANDEAARLLKQLPGPSFGAEVRVHRAVARSLDENPMLRPGPRSSWLLPALGAAVGAVLVAFGVWWGAGLAVDPEVVPLAAALDSPAVWRSQALTSGVALSFQGSGDVGGDSAHPRIDWERGVLNVEVVPGRGIDLQVRTREATVQVVGTGFSVTRDALGTQVHVLHGRVSVDCGGGDSVFLDPGDDHTCLPRSAAAMLGRARTLQARGASAGEVSAAVDRGLAQAGAEGTSGAVIEELRVLRIESLAQAGRAADALAEADAYLTGPAPARAAEVLRLAGQLESQRSGCASAAQRVEARAVALGLDAATLAGLQPCGEPGR